MSAIIDQGSFYLNKIAMIGDLAKFSITHSVEHPDGYFKICADGCTYYALDLSVESLASAYSFILANRIAEDKIKSGYGY